MCISEFSYASIWTELELVRLEGFICKSKKFFLLLKRMRPFGHKVARSG